VLDGESSWLTCIASPLAGRYDYNIRTSCRCSTAATPTACCITSFGGELLDPIGVPGIWFPFGIGVSRTPYVYAIEIPLVAIVIVRTSPST